MSDYYMWLLAKVDALHRGGKSYSYLMQLLFTTKYEYAFAMDSNRAMAGENLRSIYALEAGLYLEDVYEGPCTVLEMLIALADTIAFDMNDFSSEWFWHFLDNLGISEESDEVYDENYILDRLYTWMDHKYEMDGTGSLFPLKETNRDCRNMEIWDQMNAYLVENFPVGNWIE